MIVCTNRFNVIGGSCKYSLKSHFKFFFILRFSERFFHSMFLRVLVLVLKSKNVKDTKSYHTRHTVQVRSGY